MAGWLLPCTPFPRTRRWLLQRRPLRRLPGWLLRRRPSLQDQDQGWFSDKPKGGFPQAASLYTGFHKPPAEHGTVVPPDPGPTTNSTNNLIVGLVHVRTCIGDSIGTNTDAVTNSVTNSCKHRPMKHQPGTAVTRNMIRKHAESHRY